MDSPTRGNIELKARYADHDFARRSVAALGARPAGVERQVDTYFAVPHGRLKLRVIDDHQATLIWYRRPDQAVARQCDYQLVPVADAAGLRAALAGAVGLRGEVVKRREIHLWDNVRIHLDEVAGLGRFIEFEAVLSLGVTAETGHRQVAELCRALDLRDDAIVAVGYADLLALG